MTGTTRWGLLVATVMLSGCAQTSDAPKEPGTEIPVEEQPFRPDLAGSALSRSPTQTPEPPSRRFAERARLVAVDAAQGEDGFGGVVSALAPVKLIVEDAGVFAATATEPVLRIGEFSFHRYRVEEGALVFIAADRSAFDGYSEAELQYGEQQFTIAIDWEAGP